MKDNTNLETILDSIKRHYIDCDGKISIDLFCHNHPLVHIIIFSPYKDNIPFNDAFMHLLYLLQYAKKEIETKPRNEKTVGFKKERRDQFLRDFKVVLDYVEFDE